MIDVVIVDVEDAKKFIGTKAVYEGKNVECVKVSKTSATLKTDDGQLFKVLWTKLLCKIT